MIFKIAVRLVQDFHLNGSFTWFIQFIFTKNKIMSHHENSENSENKKGQNPASGKKIPSGSRSVHSELDNSTEDGYQPNKEKKDKSE